MRIVGGKHGGRKIPVPSSHVRPTSERVREALMNILSPSMADCRVLDCFAGSGAFGFEALSRNASHTTFVEAQRSICQILADTAKALGEEEQTTILQGDAVHQLETLVEIGTRFDLLFFDPPYRKSLLSPCLELCFKLANKDALIIAEHPPDEPPPDSVSGLVLYDRRRYGSTALTFYEAS